MQRIVELWIARRNERHLRLHGAYEVGANHYKYMLILHSSFFIGMVIEVTFMPRPMSPFFSVLFCALLLLQALRIWCIHSLGRFWNTKILILPHTSVVRKGPYRFMRHPNYFVVTLEILLIPLLFQAYVCAIVFTICNAIILAVRIPAEEQALRQATNYQDVFS